MMTETDPTPIRLLGLSGSIRRTSASTAILRTIGARLTMPVTLSLFDLRPLPPYDEDDDDEGREPPVVVTLKQAVAACDGLLVVTPEYNHSIPGVLKNAVDWVSRPGYESILKGKPVAMATVSSSPRGGIRAQSHLHDVFLSTLSRIVPGRQVAIGNIESKIRDGALADESSLRIMMRMVADLIDEIKLVRRRTD